MKNRRRNLDAYYTADWMTKELLSRVSVSGKVLEPCVGAGDMAHVLAGAGLSVVGTDIAPLHFSILKADAREESVYKLVQPDWVVTNPPFSAAWEILKQARKHAKEGVALLLRLSFLEPLRSQGSRGEWLPEHPPTKVIVLPRYSFTGDGKTDSVTCAWMIWERGQAGCIEIATPAEFKEKAK